MTIGSIGRRLAGGLLAAGIVAIILADATVARARAADPPGARTAAPVADLACPNPCVMDPRPDLVVQSVDIASGRDGWLYVSAIVKNVGLSDAPLFYTTFSWRDYGHVMVHDFGGPSKPIALAAGQSAVVGPYPLYPCWSFPATNTYWYPLTIRATADATNLVNESHENNNDLSTETFC